MQLGNGGNNGYKRRRAKQAAVSAACGGPANLLASRWTAANVAAPGQVPTALPTESWATYSARMASYGVTGAIGRYWFECKAGWPLYAAAARKMGPTAEEKAQAIVDALMAKQKALEAEKVVTTPPDARRITIPPPMPPVSATLPVDSAPPGVPRSLIDQYRTQGTVYAGAASPMTAAVATQAPPTAKKKGAGIGTWLAIGIPAALMMFAG